MARGFDVASALSPEVFQAKQSQKKLLQDTLLGGLSSGAIDPVEAVPALRKLGLDDFIIQEHVPTAERTRLDAQGGGPIPGNDGFELQERALIQQKPATTKGGGMFGSSLKGIMLQNMANIATKRQNNIPLTDDDLRTEGAARFILEQEQVKLVPGPNGSLRLQTTKPNLPDVLGNVQPQQTPQVGGQAVTPSQDVSAKTVVAKTLSSKDLDDLGKRSALTDRINNINTSFKDDFVGYKLGDFAGDVAIGFQKRFGEGSDQANFWQNYQELVNAVRNDQFGSALTQTEKIEFLKAMVTPSMKPELARRNLKRQQEITRTAMKRKMGGLKAGGFDANQIGEATKGVVLEDPEENFGDLTPEEIKELQDARKTQG